MSILVSSLLIGGCGTLYTPQYQQSPDNPFTRQGNIQEPYLYPSPITIEGAGVKLPPGSIDPNTTPTITVIDKWEPQIYRQYIRPNKPNTKIQVIKSISIQQSIKSKQIKKYKEITKTHTTINYKVIINTELLKIFVLKYITAISTSQLI
jgi:hypothetical protein